MTNRSRRPPPLELSKKPLPARPTSSVYSAEFSSSQRSPTTPPPVPQKGFSDMSPKQSNSEITGRYGSLRPKDYRIEPEERGRTRRRELAPAPIMIQNKSPISDVSSSARGYRQRRISPEDQQTLNSLLPTSPSSKPNGQQRDRVTENISSNILANLQAASTTTPTFTPNFSRLPLGYPASNMRQSSQLQLGDAFRKNDKNEDSSSDSSEEVRPSVRKDSSGKIQTLLGIGVNFPMPPTSSTENVRDNNVPITPSKESSRFGIDFSKLSLGLSKKDHKNSPSKPVTVPRRKKSLVNILRSSEHSGHSNQSSVSSLNSNSSICKTTSNHSPMNSDASSLINDPNFTPHTPMSIGDEDWSGKGLVHGAITDDDNADFIQSFYASHSNDDQGRGSAEFHKEIDRLRLEQDKHPKQYDVVAGTRLTPPVDFHDLSREYYTSTSRGMEYMLNGGQHDAPVSPINDIFDLPSPVDSEHVEIELCKSNTNTPKISEAEKYGVRGKTSEAEKYGVRGKRLVEEEKSKLTEEQQRNLKTLSSFGFNFNDKTTKELGKKPAAEDAPNVQEEIPPLRVSRSSQNMKSRSSVRNSNNKKQLTDGIRYDNLERLVYLPNFDNERYVGLDDFPVPPPYTTPPPPPAGPPPSIPLPPLPSAEPTPSDGERKESDNETVVPQRPVLSSRWSVYSTDDEEKEKPQKLWRRSKSHVRNNSSVSNVKQESRVDTLRKHLKMKRRQPITSAGTFGSRALQNSSQNDITDDIVVSTVIDADVNGSTSVPSTPLTATFPMSPVTSAIPAFVRKPSQIEFVRTHSNGDNDAEAQPSQYPQIKHSSSLANIGDYTKQNGSTTTPKTHRLRTSKSTIEGWGLKSSKSNKDLRAAAAANQSLQLPTAATALPSIATKDEQRYSGMWI